MGGETQRAFLIADLSGYGALTEAHDDPVAGRILARYIDLAENSASSSARLLARSGDELLFVADAPAALVTTALRLREAVEREPLLPALRAGIHAGPALELEGRYVGPGLTLTARVAAHARAGQILCTRQVAEAAAGLPGVDYRPLGRVRLKNTNAEVELFEVVTTACPEEVPAVDPVCGRSLELAAAAGSVVYRDRTWYFCSLSCIRNFATAPEAYAGR